MRDAVLWSILPRLRVSDAAAAAISAAITHATTECEYGHSEMPKSRLALRRAPRERFANAHTALPLKDYPPPARVSDFAFAWYSPLLSFTHAPMRAI